MDKKPKYLTKYLTKYFISEEFPVEARILNFVCFLGVIAVIIALITMLINQMPLFSILTLIIMVASFSGVFFFSIMYPKATRLITAFVIYGLSVVFFPLHYYTNGGDTSGLMTYFVLTIILDFLLLKGRTRVFALIITSAVTVFCYVSTMFLGWTALPKDGMNNIQRFIDIMQSIFVAGFLIGFVIIFQNRIYLKEKRKAETANEKIIRNEELLTLVNKAAAILLTASDEENIEISLSDGMGLISRYIDIDRVNIFKNEIIDGELHFTLLYRWLGTSAQRGTVFPTKTSFPYNLIPEGEEKLKKGECVNSMISALPETDRAFYTKNGIKSALIIPVFLHEHFWGNVSFLDYRQERVFSEDETEILRSASMMMINAVHRSEQTAKIREANVQARLMLDSTPLCCEIWDQELNIFECNEEAVKLFNAKDKQELMEQYFELSPEEQPDGTPSVDKAVIMLKKAMEEGSCVYEWMHKTLNGTPIPCEITLVRVSYAGSYVIAAYNRDLREHKEMMNEIEHRDILLNTVNNAATILSQSETGEFATSLHRAMGMLGEVVGADRVYIWKNHIVDGRLYCTQLYEWSGGAEPQQGSDITIDIPYDENIPSWEAILSKGDCVNNLVRNLSPEEQEQLSPQGILSILVVPVFLREQFWGFIGFDDCNRERKFTENEEVILRSGSLLIANAMLRNDMTQELAATLEEAQAANRAKSEFLSNMSHEIRTPLNAVIGMTSIGITSTDYDRKQYCFNKIRNASNHLLGVVNDILDMSKIEAGKLELSPSVFNFEKMLQRVVDVVNFRIDEKRQIFKMQFDNKIPDILLGDDHRLAQVITNLLGNAVKFTPENGEIRLAANLLNHEKNMCQIQVDVYDTGIGISEEQQSRLFQSFQQAESGTSRKFGGTGLGLVISKNIIEMMGGEIWVKSEFGKGSVFSFTVKLEIPDEKNNITANAKKFEREQADELEYFAEMALRADISKNNASDEEEKEKTNHFEGFHILLADDVEINREIALALIEPTMIKVDCASNGIEAVRIFSENPDKYDLIFMDIQMPEMDGYEATRKIRALNTRKSKDIPIVAMTANVFREDIEKCIEAGMNNHVGKPLDMEVVLKILRNYLIKK